MADYQFPGSSAVPLLLLSGVVVAYLVVQSRIAWLVLVVLSLGVWMLFDPVPNSAMAQAAENVVHLA